MGLVLNIRAVPNAARSQLVGWHGDALKVKLQAPPADGKANTELIRLLADVFEVPPRAITLESGQTSRNKRVHIEGREPDDLSKWLTG